MKGFILGYRLRFVFAEKG